MADFTPESQFSVMNVVSFMTGYTHPGSFFHKQGLRVAFGAFDAAVLVQKRIPGLFKMIKIVSFPGFSVMAELTFFAKKPLVIIIFFMAIVAEL